MNTGLCKTNFLNGIFKKKQLDVFTEYCLGYAVESKKVRYPMQKFFQIGLHKIYGK